ncbi:uncharacterized protein [Aegilops tauschii subsp. strangulata]|nr:uncharacterized protein LOC109731659 [Aegilops tauschii subsp. strangulata]
MVKLATAREARLYGQALAVRRWEYINADAYMFGTLLLAAGLAALCASEGGVGATDAGLAVAGVALAVVAAVNAHDLGAHLAGVDCHVGLARFDPQLGIVEFLAPALHAAGCVLAIVSLALQLFSQGDKLERRAAAPACAGAAPARTAAASARVAVASTRAFPLRRGLSSRRGLSPLRCSSSNPSSRPRLPSPSARSPARRRPPSPLLQRPPPYHQPTQPPPWIPFCLLPLSLVGMTGTKAAR